MPTVIIDGQEKETKYTSGWLDSYNHKWILEEMTTNHLMNVYKHIQDRMYFLYYGEKNHNKLIDNVKSELLSRGLTDSEIENHVEETWKMGPNPYRIEV